MTNLAPWLRFLASIRRSPTFRQNNPALILHLAALPAIAPVHACYKSQWEAP
jgi:hypothetical protein